MNFTTRKAKILLHLFIAFLSSPGLRLAPADLAVIDSSTGVLRDGRHLLLLQPRELGRPPGGNHVTKPQAKMIRLPASPPNTIFLVMRVTYHCR
jgi:hypothetical protein